MTEQSSAVAPSFQRAREQLHRDWLPLPERIAPKTSRIRPARKIHTTWINEDWKSVRSNAFLRCGIKTSFRLTPIDHRKNKLVTKTNGKTYFRSVREADADATGPPCLE